MLMKKSSVWNTCKVVMVLAVLVLMVSGCGSGDQSGTDYPERDIECLVTVNPGGGMDTNVRTFVPYFQKYLPNEVNITVKNVPGGDHAIGINEILNARGDGYTMGLFLQAFTLNQAVGKANFDLTKVEWLGCQSSSPAMLTVLADSPYNSVEDLVEASKKKTLNTSVPGISSVIGVGSMVFANETGMDVNIIPAQSAADNMVALLRGEIDFLLSTYPTAASAIENEQVRVIEVYSNERLDYLPEIPTCLENGRTEELVNSLETLYMIGVPPGINSEVLSIMRDAFKKGVEDSDYQSDILKAGCEANYKTPEECNNIIVSSLDYITKNKEVMLRYMK